ncbi:hypothetical protein B0H13DRAFT_1927278 [Mycena leptocephala]|nr:hypothetical protein B0H13DRAFT_1927278 [Mycena leptocephala]
MSEFTSQRRLGLKASLRTACKFLPMPLCLGWDTDPTGDDSSPDAKVTGLLLSDIASGATRVVEGAWMHALYKHTSIAYPPGTIVMNLREAGYTSKIGLPHIAMISTLIIQIFVVLVFMAHGSTRREGALLLAGGLMRILECVFAWKYPPYRPPRSHNQRFCALHTGMTTKHILVIRRLSIWKTRLHLGDRSEKIGGKLGSGEQSKSRSGSARGVYGNHFEQFPHPVSAPGGYRGKRARCRVGKCLTTRHSVVLDTENPMLDRVVAACQFANSVSIGFVENILPDSDGSHEDYRWISTVLGPGPDLEEHPHHQQATTVLQSTLKRRREHQGDSSRHCNNIKIQPWVLNSPSIFLWFYHPWLARSHSQGIDISMVVGATEISYMLRNEEDGAWYSPEDAEGIR